ncbi:MAG TPA: bifunctional 4-hydroxy-2-oxoglutarate aldolase/2-dehydro-3-deoxy-phosphogluconate aldolase [Ktedonosporobacter sp.]|nr:bifunctional 4-hydroxy-2-oxoglutarate aldolase/2-dehydro-3-deoxy-phosphogluconate aldolase [Ktedonosporobacter sp.]
MSTVFEEIVRTRIVAVVRLADYEQASEVAHALIAGGISVIEFTLTGKGATAAITKTRTEFADKACIGVGTVLTPEDASSAIDAGAQFVVTPVMRPDVITTCRSRGIPIICGALTPTEALAAHEAGAEMIKIFPARVGGPQYIRDLLAPLPHLHLVPTGGIDAQNASSYLQAGAVAVGIGGNLVSAHAATNGHWDEITRRAQECVRAIAM